MSSPELISATEKTIHEEEAAEGGAESMQELKVGGQRVQEVST